MWCVVEVRFRTWRLPRPPGTSTCPNGAAPLLDRGPASRPWDGLPPAALLRTLGPGCSDLLFSDSSPPRQTSRRQESPTPAAACAAGLAWAARTAAVAFVASECPPPASDPSPPNADRTCGAHSRMGPSLIGRCGGRLNAACTVPTQSRAGEEQGGWTERGQGVAGFGRARRTSPMGPKPEFSDSLQVVPRTHVASAFPPVELAGLAGFGRAPANTPSTG